MTTLADIYPVLGLRIQAGPVILSPVMDDDIPALVDLALEGVHDPDVMPFSSPWTAAPPDQLPARTAQYYWEKRAAMTPAQWHLLFAVRYKGELVGVQGICTCWGDFRVARAVETGSWIVQRAQGRGIGTAMRQVVCAFAFDHVGAEVVTSSAFSDNPASQGVSRKVGYVANGDKRVVVQGKQVTAHDLILTPDRLARYEHTLTVTGLEPALRQLGLTS